MNRKRGVLTIFLLTCCFMLALFSLQTQDNQSLASLGRELSALNEARDSFFQKFKSESEMMEMASLVDLKETSASDRWKHFSGELVPGYPETAFPAYTSSSSDSRQLFYEIVTRQYPPDCKRAPKMLVPEWAFGFGTPIPTIIGV